MTPLWNDYHLFSDGDTYFTDLLASIHEAQESIWVEVYIFESDRLGARISSALVEAARRGVRVNVLIDAVGCISSQASLEKIFDGTGVSLAVYHPIPFLQPALASTLVHSERVHPGGSLFFDSLLHMFRRNHRKIIVIDHRKAWVGGMNLSEVHCAEFVGIHAWRDTALRISGPGVGLIQAAVKLLWLPVLSMERAPVRRALRDHVWRTAAPGLLLNSSIALRRKKNRVLLDRVRSARHRIFITTAYFIPTRRMLAALKTAAERGVDVKILVPQRADVLFMPWAAQTFFATLLKNGVHIFEYIPRMLHAKTLIIDDWGIVGTSNFNHRSFQQDLEIDIVITQSECLSQLSQQFMQDLEESEEITQVTLKNRPLWQRLLGRLALLFESQL